MAASHASRVAITRGRSLDSRTWADLNLDDVLIAIDRTESTLGQPTTAAASRRGSRARSATV